MLVTKIQETGCGIDGKQQLKVRVSPWIFPKKANVRGRMRDLVAAVCGR